MDHDDFIAASRAYLADQYLHHRRLVAVCKGFGGEKYHRTLMIQARRAFLSIKGLPQ